MYGSQATPLPMIMKSSLWDVLTHIASTLYIISKLIESHQVFADVHGSFILTAIHWNFGRTSRSSRQLIIEGNLFDGELCYIICHLLLVAVDCKNVGWSADKLLLLIN
jgi:hypothetical protein